MSEKKTQTKTKVSKNAEQVKMSVKKLEPYIGANVRDENDNIIGIIPSGHEVKLLEDFKTAGERIKIEGADKKGKLISGTILKSMLK